MKRSPFFIIAIGFLAFQLSDALPKFSTRQGAKCQSCHINPTGKGMRSTFGSTYGREELPMETFKEKTDIDDFSTNLNEIFTIGMDYRTLFFYQPRGSETSFLQMQGDLYLDLRINKKFRIYYDKGLYSGFEVFGLAKVLPLDGYVKIGKFMPAYGIRIDDHNAFIRGGQYGGGEFARVFPAGYPNGLRFGERSEDTGIELGINPSIFTFSVGVFNGTPGGGLNGVTGEKTKAFVARGDMNIQTDFANLVIGGSFYNNPNYSTPGKTQFYGGFGIFTLAKNATLISEVDRTTTYNVVSNSEVQGLMTFNELDYIILRGVDLKVGYEWYDPDTKIKNGSYSSVTIGAELFPFTGVEVRPQYRFNYEQPKEINNDELQILLHLYL
ncbi:MAG: hypothetical protein PHP42_09015 [Bacteroidota bacterium]|nr:hypothetical protein [Bacteroidota bacterium]